MEKVVKVNIKKCIQDSQEFGSDNEYMVSRVFFDIESEGTKYENLFVNIKQTVGSSYETGTIEVESPKDYKGPFNYVIFAEEIRRYFRNLVGSQGSGIKISGNCSNIRMYNNTFIVNHNFQFVV